jgi:hypothetical protein
MRRFAFAMNIFFTLIIAAHAESGACKISIDSPATGATVGRSGTVEGTAVVPLGKYLWGFGHLVGDSEVWPQGGGPRILTDGRFMLRARYGEASDIGENFEVVFVIVSADQNAQLLSWVEASKHIAPPPSTKMPDSVEGCPIARIAVKKVSH